jgi:hypothetical protein
MASPFRYNKKERRRLRKSAKKSLDEKILAKWDPATVDSIKRLAALTERQAKARRVKKRPTIQS